MLNQSNTRELLAELFAAMPGSSIAEEGQALVWDTDNGVAVVRPSTGAAGEVFAGFSKTRNNPPSQAPFVGSVVVPENAMLELPRLPVAGQLALFIDGVKLTEVADAAAVDAANKFSISARVVTLHEDAVDSVLSYQLMSELTVDESRRMIGDAPVGGISALTQDMLTSITHATQLCTTCYDASVEFVPGTHPRLGANGTLTAGGTGTELTSVVILEAPTSEESGLTVRVKV